MVNGEERKGKTCQSRNKGKEKIRESNTRNDKSDIKLAKRVRRLG